MPIRRLHQGQEGLVDGPLHVLVDPRVPQEASHTLHPVPVQEVVARHQGVHVLPSIPRRALEPSLLLGKLMHHVLRVIGAACLLAGDGHLHLLRYSTHEGLPGIRGGPIALRQDVVLEVLQHDFEVLLDVLPHPVALQDVVHELLVDLCHELPLRVGGLCNLQPLHERGARQGVDQQREQRDAAHVEEHPVGVLGVDLAAGLVPRDLDAQRQADGAPQPAPAHHDGVGQGHGPAVRPQQRQQGSGEDDEAEAQDDEDRVDQEQVAVVRQRGLDHNLPRQSASEEEDEGVPQVLQHVPDGVHGLVANHLRPHRLRQHQRGHDGAEHPAELQPLGDHERQVGGRDGEQDLDGAA
mmetsp:Transcript_9953/g.31615  ORF Transcript_9953/g.31615 Transcript_9953/m.31615 type:complete len:352 (-) Transcript_9953:775-1830(-)